MQDLSGPGYGIIYIIMTHFAIVGAGGLVGRQLLQELLHQSTARITVVGRSFLALDHPRVEEKVVDFTDEWSLQSALAGCEAVFVAVGTTRQKVKGDMEAYRKVDFDIPLAVARACVANGISRFLLVSSVGANSRSRNFYLRLKGEVEDAIAGLPISFIGFFQPSLLLGTRTEFRLGERISQLLMPRLSFLLPDKYKPITATAVARAMVREAGSTATGVRRYTFSEMKGVTESAPV